MRRHGFTFIEILIVMILIGVIAAIGIPRIRDAIQRTNVRSTRVALTTMVAKARAAAVQRGCVSTFHVGTDGNAWVSACRNSGPGVDTLGGVEQLGARFNVTLRPDRTDMQFDPRGLNLAFVTNVVRFSSNSSSSQDSVIINPVGKVVR